MKQLLKKYFNSHINKQIHIVNSVFKIFILHFIELNNSKIYIKNTMLLINYELEKDIINSYYRYIFNFYKIAYNNLILFYRRYKFITFVGLGFKKRLERRNKKMYLFFGHRHWIVFEIPKILSVYFIKRKSLIMYSNKKYILSEFMTTFKDFKKESMFKIKGLFDIRSKKRWLFMRRAKIRGLRVKLSKKQKLL